MSRAQKSARWWDPKEVLPLPRAWFRYTDGAVETIPSGTGATGGTTSRVYYAPNGQPLPADALYSPLREPGASTEQELTPVDVIGSSLLARVRTAGGASVPAHEALLLELVDAAWLIGSEGARRLHALAAHDSAGAHAILLEHFWGTSLEERQWMLTRAPTLELAVRLLPLLGCQSIGDLRDGLRLLFGRRVRVSVDDSAASEAFSLASALRFSCDDDDVGVPEAKPPVVGPAPFVRPRLHLWIDTDADTHAEALGFQEAHPTERPGLALARWLGRLHVGPHVEVHVVVPALREQGVSRGARRVTSQAARTPSAPALAAVASPAGGAGASLALPCVDALVGGSNRSVR
jgi:hypothetical protein